MKNSLIILANNIKFVSEILYNKPYKYNTKENLRYYLWMCELKLFIINKYSINVDVYPSANFNNKYLISIIKDQKVIYDTSADYDSYESALEAGLIETLFNNLINKFPNII